MRESSLATTIRTIPEGCTITNIRRGKGAREQFVYASLISPDGELLISATLEYITQQIMQSKINSQEGDV